MTHDPERVRRVLRAVTAWTGQLVDPGARNSLLYYRDLERGTLDLGGADRVALGNLLAGRTVRLSTLFPDPGERPPAARRARTVRAKARENYEERGLETLFLAWGMATWEDQRAARPPAAPILLVPVRLAPRGAAEEDFDLAVVAEEAVNPTLLYKLAREFDCRIADDDLLDLLEGDGPVPDAGRLFERLAKLTADVPGFRVADRVVLGNFSYAKLPMVRDLESLTDALVAHDLIAALAGDQGARAAVRARAVTVAPDEPDRVPPADEFLVLDADASQNAAVNAVVRGQDLVVDGPPGTGKSQTIANLIATLVARGQRVLFVAEKRAAIDAVVGRLAARGLGELVLDLHDGGSRRRRVAQDLARALTQTGGIPQVDLTDLHRTVELRRGRLADHDDALHRPRQPWGVSVFDAQSRLLGTDPAARTPVRFRGADLARLDAATYRQAREDLRAWAGLAVAADSPWARAAVTSPVEAEQALDTVATLAHHTLPAATAALDRALAETGLARPVSLGEWRQTVALLDAVAAAATVFDAELWEQDLDQLASDLAPAGRGGFARLAVQLTSAPYRRALAALRARCRDRPPKPPALRKACVYAGEQSRRWGERSVDGGPPRPPGDLPAVVGTYNQFVAELDTLATWLPRQEVEEPPVAELSGLLGRLLADRATLTRLPELHRLGQALDRAGLAGLLAELARRGLSGPRAIEALEHAWLASILDQVAFADPRVGAFDGALHTQTVAEYRTADATHVETSAVRVRRACAERATRTRDQHPEESTAVEHQARLTRRHLPMRELFQLAPHVLTALKPCWAMSPLVVSQLLPGDRTYFDVVVFDEASQIRPADAVPAILRADRVVVAGDERQLPPTSFFASTTVEDDEPDEPGPGGSLAMTEGFESILDALGALLRSRMLTWHYRSRDERLIAFSNLHVYDRALTTFPGVAGGDCVGHVLVPFRIDRGAPEDSLTDEVHEVVRLVLEHAGARPEESLGVIAMGIRHANRVAEALRLAKSDHPELAGFFDEQRDEPFFVKNLERVQGDERDAIILTVGYGKNQRGELPHRFGPLLQQGGERRLNVAVTRAKRRMTLVSSFSSADMGPARGGSRGVELLRRFLAYAEARGAGLRDEGGGPPTLDPFEADVRDRLRAAGIPLVARHGSSGSRVDFAARHPAKPDRFVLAIECDGAAYHAAPTVRDRDRLRQDHLERLDWAFHRVWSTDWCADPVREVDKAVAAWRAAVARADAVDLGAEARHGAEAEVEREREAAAGPATPRLMADGGRPGGELAGTPLGGVDVPERGLRPQVPRGLTIDEYRPGQLAAMVSWIESDTLLRTEGQLVEEVMDELGFQRRGRRIEAAILAAVRQARRNQA